MAIIKAIDSKASIGRVINYVTKEEKTEEMLLSGIDCEPETAIDEMKATKELWHKTDGRQYKHYVHSFAPGENITHEQAHELAKELCRERFKGYEVLIATHKDTDHIHTHIIVNSVSYENGYKFQQSKYQLQEMKDHCNDLCREYGLSVAEKGKTFEGQNREEMTAWSKDKYNLLEKADKGKVKSYVLDTAVAVMECKSQSISKQDFINKMYEKGYQTNWKDNHTYITFTDIKRQEQGEKLCEVRNSNIEKTFKVNLSKEELEHEFEQNRGREEQRRTEPTVEEQPREEFKTIGDKTAGTTEPDRREKSSITNTRTSDEITRTDTIPKNERIGSGIDESRERTTKTDVDELYKQLHGVRGLDKKFNPKEQRKLREESERAKHLAESKARELAKQQRNFKSKSKKHLPEL